MGPNPTWKGTQTDPQEKNFQDKTRNGGTLNHSASDENCTSHSPELGDLIIIERESRHKNNSLPWKWKGNVNWALALAWLERGRRTAGGNQIFCAYFLFPPVSHACSHQFPLPHLLPLWQWLHASFYCSITELNPTLLSLSFSHRFLTNASKQNNCTVTQQRKEVWVTCSFFPTPLRLDI